MTNKISLKIATLTSGAALITGGMLLLTVSKTQAQIITFERGNAPGYIPEYIPEDELKIDTQFEVDFGVTFGLDTDGNGLADDDAFPILEESGDGSIGSDAFTYDRPNPSLPDTEAPLFTGQLGDFFLKTGSNSGDDQPSLIIHYSNPVREASGEIWDIDGRFSLPGFPSPFEQWMVEALDRDYDLVAFIDSPQGLAPGVPGSLDGEPWTWNIQTARDFHTIRISFIGNTRVVGLAFDNFSPSQAARTESVPESSSILSLITFGGLATSSALLRNKKQNQNKSVEN